MPNRSRKKDKANEFSLIPERKLLELYGWTVRCRLLGELLEGMPRPLAPHDLEAAAVAVCLDLKSGDEIFTLGREVLPAYVRSRTLEAAFDAIREERSSIAARLKEALATARAMKQAGRGHLAAVFGTGAAATSGAWGKALRIAHAETLPLIFVWMLDPDAETSGHAEHGFPAIPADCHDVVAIYRVASESFTHARHGHGATMIECVPWTLGPGESEDAVLNLERYLAPRGIATDRTKAAAKAGFARKLSNAANAALVRQTGRPRSR